MDRDLEFMKAAYCQALKAESRGEIPAGAVVISTEDDIIGRGANACISLNDPTAHAEILALREAGRSLTNYRLTGCQVFSTLEPCPMCLMAMIHARIKRVVYGTPEPRWGAAGSLLNLPVTPGLNHHLEVVGGLMAQECQALMKEFFQKRRGTEVVVTGATRNRLVRC